MFRPDCFECDDVLEQEDLVKFYQKLDYQFLEEGDAMMVNILGINSSLWSGRTWYLYLLKAFAAACKATQATSITLDCQPFGLRPRLPYREKLEHLDPEPDYLLPDQEDLVKFYEKLGYIFLKDEDEMMVRFLK